MRKIIFTILILLFIVNVNAQQYHEKNFGYENCSKSKQLQNEYKNMFDVNPEWYNDYNIHFYEFDIEADDETVDINGTVTIHATTIIEDLSTITFELHSNHTISDIKINDISKPFTRNENEVYVETEPLAINTNIEIEVSYSGTAPNNGFFSGMSTGTWDEFPVTWSLSEPYGALEWFPCKQDLTDKADSVHMFVTVENPAVVGSNGLLTAQVEVAPNHTRYEWKTNYPIAYYLISIAISDYQDYSIYAHPEEMAGDSILIQNFIFDSEEILNEFQADIDETSGLIEFFSDKYGLYPFHEEKYGHCLAPMGGGMEHQTMTTQQGFEFGLTAHELGHQWFGDNVTCETWQDIWINEGFATYTDYLAEYYLHSSAIGDAWMNSCHNTVMSYPDGSIYVPEEDLGNIYRIFSSRLSYKKGASMVHMIRWELQDDDLFFDVLKQFQIEYQNSVATGDKFKEVLEEVSGKDFDQFFDQWYYGEGYPTYHIEYSNLNEYFILKSTQSSSTEITPFFNMLMEYELTFDDGSTERILIEQTDNVTEYSNIFGKEVVDITVDPDNWQLNKVSDIVVDVQKIDFNSDFAFWPNPATSTLHIEGLENNKSYDFKLLDISGKEIVSKLNITGKNEINVSELKPGIYILQFENDSLKKTKQLIIQ